MKTLAKEHVKSCGLNSWLLDCRLGTLKQDMILPPTMYLSRPGLMATCSHPLGRAGFGKIARQEPGTENETVRPTLDQRDV